MQVDVGRLPKRLVLGISLLSGMLMVLSPSQAFAASRSCDARVRVDLHAFGNFPAESVTIETFSARASDSGANGARRKARNRAQACARAVWSKRWINRPNGHGIPDKCKSSSGVHNFGMTNFKCRIFQAMCGLMEAQGRNTNWASVATVWTMISGQTGACLQSELHSNSYFLDNCSEAERLFVCPN